MLPSRDPFWEATAGQWWSDLNSGFLLPELLLFLQP